MTRYGNEKEKMRSLLDPGPVPEIVEMRLREAYAALPERRPARPPRPRRCAKSRGPRDKARLYTVPSAPQKRPCPHAAPSAPVDRSTFTPSFFFVITPIRAANLPKGYTCGKKTQSSFAVRKKAPGGGGTGFFACAFSRRREPSSAVLCFYSAIRIGTWGYPSSRYGSPYGAKPTVS